MGLKALSVLMVLGIPLTLLGYWLATSGRKQSVSTMLTYFHGNPDTRPYFIFQCLNGKECGGLADRQKGMVTAYIISQILDMRFGIYVDKPCPLQNYLVPNHVDWRVGTDIMWGRNRTEWNRIGRDSEAMDLTFPNITSKVKTDVIIFRGNIDRVYYLMNNTLFHHLPWTKNLSHHDVYKYVYDKLFKLSSSTQTKMDEFLKKVGKHKLVCAHLRIGRSSTMPSDPKRPLTSPNPQAVIDFLTKLVKQEKSYKIFLATDDESVKTKFSKSFGSNFIEIEGPIVHVNLARRNVCRGVEKAVLDQHVLSLCDTLIMSRSGFSRMAALFRGSDRNLYEVVKDNVTQVSRLDPTFFGKL